MGKSEREIRLSFDTSAPFATIQQAVEKVHNYDVPMIIYEPSEAASPYLRGELSFPSVTEAEKKAALLINVHSAACVQLLGTTASIKTTRKKQSEVDALLGSGLSWVSIGGNPAYMTWFDDETAGTSASKNGGVLQAKTGALPSLFLYIGVPVAALGLLLYYLWTRKAGPSFYSPGHGD